MKKFYNILLLMAALAFITQAALGQTPGHLTGLVVDDKGAPLPYGTVALLKAADASVLTGTAIELNGTFKMKTPAAGKYLVRISAMGFATQDLPVLEVTSEGYSRDFGKIALKQDAKVLKEVTVQNLRPTVDVQADKMVVSVEGTAMAAGNTAYDVLAKSPGVWVDQDGNIQLNGKQGVKVMIDGKLTYLDGKQLQTLLQGMPADNLKNLEIIANPSAKFDAEGSAGIINLNLKKNNLNGLNGSVYAGYLNNTNSGGNGGLNLNLKQGKWSSSATVDLAERPRKRSFTMDRIFVQEGKNSVLTQAGKEDGRTFAPSARFGTVYDLNKNHSVGATLSLSGSNTRSGVSTASTLEDPRLAGTVFNQTRTHNNGKFNSASFNAHYLGKLDTLGTTLSADVDVARINDHGRSDFFNLRTFATSSKEEKVYFETDNPTSYQIYSAKLDYVKPFPKVKGKLELGAKGSYVESDNQIDFFSFQGSQRVPDPLRRGDHFIYEENILAGYSNFSATLTPKVSIQAGLRAEYTQSEGNSIPENKVTPRSYLDFFPSVFVQQKITDNYQIGYNYSRRIFRPRYSHLNPFRFFIDANTYAQGNPNLKPEYTNSFQVTQTFRKNYNVILGYAHTKDDISEVPAFYPETNTMIFQQRNVESETANATFVVPVTVTSKWNMSNNVTVAYQKFTTPVDTTTVYNAQTMFTAQMNHNILLPNNFKVEVNGTYRGKGVFNIYKTAAAVWVDVAVKRSFLKDQLDVSLALTDLFRSQKMKGTSAVNGNVNVLDMYQYGQGVRLNLRYRFNKGEKFEVKRRNASLEEVNRASGN
ncbi:outer membrane beta-barrel family protein [Rufibacter glacialis]|uniref:Outer membrane beta-barrel family protein n=1 Tax=Rufibacter glacialis TaxID=1259555 RepID=A0A5M8QGN3_9BACT|nr:outer membrane beta-barrel family protein [Rufibacter glacialis]KAA6434378.1 outer membrane beta-barrel protein [Rufibacter glacialis]GGK69015.1 TonB-dependent receptor [Rufibacter glacialis]